MTTEYCPLAAGGSAGSRFIWGVGSAVRLVVLAVANFLIVIGLGGAVIIQTGQTENFLRNLELAGLSSAASALSDGLASLAPLVAGDDAVSPAPVIDADAATVQVALRPITGIRIPRIDLAAEVVPARVATLPQGMTWEVPSFKVGHAEGTAGAGETGNALLMGHVTSLTLGNVFLNLDQVRVGDSIYVSADDEAFTYRVQEVIRVPRDDISVVQPTEVAALTLLTCTGEWLPREHDYAERLIVRALLT